MTRLGGDPFSIVTPTASADGYGVSGEALVLSAVREHGADIAVIGHDWADERYCDPDFLALKVDRYLADAHDLLVLYFLPYALAQYSSRINVLQTMWETDRLPDRWAHLCRLADGIVVPSEHCREVFAERVECPVEVVPFGTDTDLYSVVSRIGREGPFTFLMAGLLHYRKGVEFALRAFREEFAASEPVELVLKTRRGFLDVGSSASVLSDERVRVIDADYTREEMRDLYHRADCFLAPSRGEGSGLTPRDAMSTGLPAIVTDWGGLRELAEVGVALEVEDLEVAPRENSSYGAGVTGGGDIGRFARPSVSHLRETMREMYEGTHWRTLVGAGCAVQMRRQYTWGRCAGEWLAALERLSARTAA